MNRGRLVIAAGALAALLAANAPASADEGLDRLDAAARACIVSSAAEVEKVTPALSDAVDFLTKDLCAIEIGRRQHYANSEQMLAMAKRSTSWGDEGIAISIGQGKGKTPKPIADFQASYREAYKDARVDPETGDIVGVKGSIEPFSADFSTYWDQPAPVELRALAARTVLEARRTRLAAH